MFENIDSHVVSLKEILSKIDSLDDLMTLFAEVIETTSEVITKI